MMRHMVKRRIRNPGRFSWTRLPSETGYSVTWRLIRKDCNKVQHQGTLTVGAMEDRGRIALRLWQTRIDLRDRVDALDLTTLGVT
jgi:hypothetical protein